MEKIEKLLEAEDTECEEELLRCLETEFGKIDQVLITDYWKYVFTLSVSCGGRMLRIVTGGDWGDISDYSATSLEWENHVQAGIKEIQEIPRSTESTEDGKQWTLESVEDTEDGKQWTLEQLASFGNPVRVQVLDFREGAFFLRVTTSKGKILRIKVGEDGNRMYRYDVQDLDWREHIGAGIRSLSLE